MEHEGDNNTKRWWTLWHNSEKPSEDTKGTEDKRQNWNLPDHSISGFCCSSRQQSENKRKWKDRQIIGSCQRAWKSCRILRWQWYQ